MIKIHFKDHGQDLLWLIVDTDTNQVIEAGPYHNQLFKGIYIFLPKYLKKGNAVNFSDTPITVANQPLHEFKYKVAKIEEI